MAGPESERPAASQETVGRIYIATDTKRMFRDRGDGWELLNAPDAIGAETPAGAQAKADAAAGAALSAAKAYADEAVAAHAGRTDNPHQVTAAQVGAPTQAAFDAHVADTNNPHNVRAVQVPYSSGVVGFSPADVAAALDALATVYLRLAMVSRLSWWQGQATRTAMGATLTGTDKWAGGVLGPDGKIYGIPLTATDILVVSTLGSMDLLTSAYLNKF